MSPLSPQATTIDAFRLFCNFHKWYVLFRAWLLSFNIMSLGFIHITVKSPTYELSRMQTCVPSMSSMSEIEVHPPPLLSWILQLHRLPPLLPSPVRDFSCLFLDASPYMPAVILYDWTFLGTGRLKMVFVCYVFLVLKYYKPTTE